MWYLTKENSDRTKTDYGPQNRYSAETKRWVTKGASLFIWYNKFNIFFFLPKTS